MKVQGVVILLLAVAMIAGSWKMFAKAGQPGWGVLIPLFNFYLMLKIAGRPGWWLLLMLIPIVNMVIAVIIAHDISKAFGHGAAFTIGLIFLPFIFYPVLGFGNDTYKPVAA